MIKEERWMAIAGFEGLFEVSDMGNVRSLSRRLRDGRKWAARKLRPSGQDSGHLHVRLCADRHHWKLVHRLVLEAFKGPCPEGMEACHENGSPCDNRLENLRRGTRLSNNADKVLHGRSGRGSSNNRAKLSDTDIERIRDMRTFGALGKDVAATFCITPANVSCIYLKKTWRHV